MVVRDAYEAGGGADEAGVVQMKQVVAAGR
jgi:hypothetical protein